MQCPFCKEKIIDGASICKHCGENMPMSENDWAELRKLIIEYKEARRTWADNFHKQNQSLSHNIETKLELANAETDDERQSIKMLLGTSEHLSNVLYDVECIMRYNLLKYEQKISPLLQKHFIYSVNSIDKELKFEEAVDRAVKSAHKKCRYNVYNIAKSNGIVAFAAYNRYDKFLESYHSKDFNRDKAIKLFSETQDMTTRATKALLNQAITVSLKTLIESNLENMITLIADKQGLTFDDFHKMVENAKNTILMEKQTAESADRAIKRRTRH